MTSTSSSMASTSSSLARRSSSMARRSSLMTRASSSTPRSPVLHPRQATSGPSGSSSAPSALSRLPRPLPRHPRSPWRQAGRKNSVPRDARTIPGQAGQPPKAQEKRGTRPAHVQFTQVPSEHAVIMRKIARAAPPAHIVVPDSSVLYVSDHSKLVSPAFDEFWSEHSGLAAMELCVPEVVRGEIVFQAVAEALRQVAAARGALRRADEICLLDTVVRLPDSRVREAVERRFDRWLRVLHGTLTTTPLTEIPWAEIASEAIWRTGPFRQQNTGKDKEKGFRDALILHTAGSIARNAPPGHRVAFICADANLRDCAEGAFAAMGSTAVYESLAALGSELKLLHERLTLDFVKTVSPRARDKFFLKDEPDCLYTRENVRLRIAEQFADELNKYGPAPQKAASVAALSVTLPGFQAIGDAHRRIYLPVFVRLEGENDFIWESIVQSLQPIKSWGYFAVDSTPHLYDLRFSVIWRARIGADGRFWSTEFLNVALKSSSEEATSMADLSRLGFTELTADHFAPPKIDWSSVTSATIGG